MSSMLIPGLEDGGLEIASLHKDRMPTGHGNEEYVDIVAVPRGMPYNSLE